MTDQSQKPEPKIEVFLDDRQYNGTPRQSALFKVYLAHFGEENLDFDVVKRAVHFAEYILDHPDEWKMHLEAA